MNSLVNTTSTNTSFEGKLLQVSLPEIRDWPFNSTLILQQIQEQVAAPATPKPEKGPFSSLFHTPLTLQQIHKVPDNLFENLEDAEGLDPVFRNNIERFVSGAVSLATELVQTKRDLARTKLAEDIARKY